MALSVLLPVRDEAATLEAALGSLEAQTLDAGEWVVVDDGSTDATPELLARWRARRAARGATLRVVRTPGMGIAGALNAGLAFCTHPWIARMDADDLCRPRRFERQLARAGAEPALALVGANVAHRALEDGLITDGMRRHVEWANSKLSHDELAQALWVDSPLPHPSWLVRRDAFETVGGYDESGQLPEDYDWLHRFFASGLRAGKAGGEPLLDWTDRAGRLTRTNPAYAPEAFNRVKLRALEARLEGDDREVFLFGLGPKAKAVVPALKARLRAIVDAHPRRAGIVYEGLEVWDVETWKTRAGQAPFVINCVGTPEARESCEQLCLAHGLKPIESFISF